MNASFSCDRLWRKRLHELSSAWPDFVGGQAAGLHKTRVATRRLREALPIVGAGSPPAKVKKLSRKMRDLTRYLGPVRELDVALEILEGDSKADDVHGRAVEMLRREVASRRQLLDRELVKKSPVGDLKKLLKKLDRLAKREDGNEKKALKYESQWRGVLAARVMRRAKSLGTALEDAGPLYAPERIHVVRIAIKKLRYVLEIAQESGLVRAGVLVRTLKTHQQRLGRLHDLEAVLKDVREAVASSGLASRMSDLAAYADSLERECRRLHAGFVEHRDELANSVREIRQDLIPALTMPPRRQARVMAAAPVARARERAR